jgi:predicted RNase H-like nuclease
VALVRETGSGWKCVAIAPSYTSFYALATACPVNWIVQMEGSEPDPPRLLAAARELLGGQSVSLVAADLPLALSPVSSRRPADDAISQHFAAQGCGTHSPTRDRPGKLSRHVVTSFAAEGFALATTSSTPGEEGHLLEVYPHPALLSLLSAVYRVPYKVSKSKSYWPSATVQERRKRLCQELRGIVNVLGHEIHGIQLPPLVSSKARGPNMKSFENALDALICAWVGTKYLKGEAIAYGDDSAAIWVPHA